MFLPLEILTPSSFQSSSFKPIAQHSVLARRHAQSLGVNRRISKIVASVITPLTKLAGSPLATEHAISARSETRKAVGFNPCLFSFARAIAKAWDTFGYAYLLNRA